MKTVHDIFITHLNNLEDEISLYKKEEDIWKISGSIKNTAGNLTLHICGNLNYYLGAAIGKTGYIRQRDLEFSQKNISRKDLLSEISKTRAMVNALFNSLKESDLNKDYPDNSFGENVSIGYVISILITHLAYHLGQINYHRRIIDCE